MIQWLAMVNIRDETTKAYLLGMQAYTEFTGKTPEQLNVIEESISFSYVTMDGFYGENRIY